MKRLRILHLGDIHFPEHDDERDVDAKDAGFPNDVQQRITTAKLGGALTKAAKLKEAVPHAVMICGDVTSYGDSDGYRGGVQTLRDALQLDTTPVEHWHVAVGNHDIDRNLVTQDGTNLEAQYGFATEAWQPHDVLAVGGPRTTKMNEGTVGLALTTLNSCVGSGLYRHMPDAVRNDISSAVDDALKTSADATAATTAVHAALEFVYERLDTPAFDASHIDAVIDVIRSLDAAIVPVLLAHHNLLPQATPRLAAYTELVNSGAMRSRLSACERPVLYMHGHIHEDPVEVVERYCEGRGKVILISAPLLVDGFNVVTIEFSEADRLLGVEIQRYRARTGGAIEADTEQTVRVGIVDHRIAPSDLTPSVLRAVQAKGVIRFPELLKQVQVEVADCTDAAVADATLEAEWAGQVEVKNRQEVPKLWIVQVRL